MSAKTEPTTKKFGSGSRSVPHHSKKAQKWYPAEDIPENKTVSGPPRIFLDGRIEALDAPRQGRTVGEALVNFRGCSQAPVWAFVGRRKQQPLRRQSYYLAHQELEIKGDDHYETGKMQSIRESLS